MKESDFPFQSTRAARMLSDGIARMSDQKVSLRELARRLGYRQPVSLSHWSTGRVPIPVERAPELAKALSIDESSLVLAVLEQRHPTINWEILASGYAGAYHFVAELESIAGTTLQMFGAEQAWVMREAAADPRAGRRWLSPHEIATVETIRKMRPGFHESGLSPPDLSNLVAALRPTTRIP